PGATSRFPTPSSPVRGRLGAVAAAAGTGAGTAKDQVRRASERTVPAGRAAAGGTAPDAPRPGKHEVTTKPGPPSPGRAAIHSAKTRSASTAHPAAPSEAEVVTVNPKDDLGRTGERVAAEYLERAGLRVLDRNWRSATGEIDIVAAERQVLVICEVKTRPGTGFGTPLEAITRHKRARPRQPAAPRRVGPGPPCAGGSTRLSVP